MSQLLDTCASAARAEETAGLSAARFSLIDTAPVGEVLVSAISVAELACLQERGRITLKEHRRVWWGILLRRTRWPCLLIEDHAMAEASSVPRRCIVTRRIRCQTPFFTLKLRLESRIEKLD